MKFLNFLYQPIKYYIENYNRTNITPLYILTLGLSIFNTLKTPPSWLASSSPDTEHWVSTGNWWLIVLLFIATCFIFFYIILAIVLIYINFRNFVFSYYIATKGYGNAIISLQKGFSDINILKAKPHPKEDEVKKTLIEFCTYVKDIYKNKLGQAECSISIKLMPEPLTRKDNILNAEVITILRDKDWKRKDLNYDSHNHFIMNNTCFRK